MQRSIYTRKRLFLAAIDYTATQPWPKVITVPRRISASLSCAFDNLPNPGSALWFVQSMLIGDDLGSRLAQCDAIASFLHDRSEAFDLLLLLCEL